MGDYLLRLLVMLPLVIALIVLALVAVKRGWLRLPAAATGGGRTAPVELVGRCALGPGASLAVVRFDGRDLLLGVSGSGSVLLAERAAGKQG